MRQSAHSFRPLTSDEREQIFVVRLAVVEGRAGESIAELAERVESPWTPEAIAVVNRRPADTPLAEGELVKLGLRRGYAAPDPPRPPKGPPRPPVIDRRS